MDVDITDWDKTRQVVESLGHFDALVNNAAVAICDPFLTCSPTDFNKYVNTYALLFPTCQNKLDKNLECVYIILKTIN